MKAAIKLLSGSLLVFSLSAHAEITPIQILGRCGSALYPVPTQPIALSTTDETPQKISRIEYKTSDANGYVYLNETYHGKMIKVYLASDHTIIADCGSRLMPVKSGVVILGENGSLCPSFCPNNLKNTNQVAHSLPVK